MKSKPYLVLAWFACVLSACYVTGGPLQGSGCAKLVLVHHLRIIVEVSISVFRTDFQTTTEPALEMLLPATARLSSTFWHNRRIASPMTPSKYNSQFGEDKYAHEHFFKNKTHGIYMELGALDGIGLSNTLFFSRQLGWKGVLIEASAHYHKLIQNRPGDVCVHAAVCSGVSQVHFIDTEGSRASAVAGIYEFMSEAFRKQWYGNLDISTVPTIPCLPLTHILWKAGIRHIDFFTLDVENAELQVLQAVDFSAVSFSVICVEADRSNPAKDAAVVELLQANRYRYHGHVDHNDWFLHESFQPS